MKQVNVSQLKNRLSEYLRLVKAGETIEIVERSTPIARIEAISPRSGTDDELLDDLVRRGLVTRGKKRLDPHFFDDKPLVTLPPGISVTDIIREDRDGR